MPLLGLYLSLGYYSDGIYVEAGISSDLTGIYLSLGLDLSGPYCDLGAVLDWVGSGSPCGAFAGSSHYLSAWGSIDSSYDIGIDLSIC